MKVYVGTSGWLYDWNEGGDLRWYSERSGLNAVELNASFYRFPFPSQVRGWARVGSGLRWAVKVHRSVTHVHRLNERGLEILRKFLRLFDPMSGLVDFYLVQMPPNFALTDENLRRLGALASIELGGATFAIEFRHETWFTEEAVREVSRLGLVFVSVDSPMGSYIYNSGGTVYLRMHGRSAWYAHDYTEAELDGVVARVLELSPGQVYVFFNNDHWMLEDARYALSRLTTLSSGR